MEKKSYIVPSSEVIILTVGQAILDTSPPGIEDMEKGNGSW